MKTLPLTLPYSSEERAGGKNAPESFGPAAGCRFHIFPRVGRNYSKHWNFWMRFFQTLELLTSTFPNIGNFASDFSNAWKKENGGRVDRRSISLGTDN